MSSKGFVVAMRARVSRLASDRPYQPTNAVAPDWLIVSRWGGQSEYLTISRASLPPDAPQAEDEPAPVGLHPHQTWFGVLTPDRSEEESIFLLNRDLPRDVPVAGRFAPAEGYVRLIEAEDGTLRLVATAREVPPARVEDPAPMLHLVAERRPWAGEFVDRAEG